MNSGRHTATQISTKPACWLGLASTISHTILQGREDRCPCSQQGHRTPRCDPRAPHPPRPFSAVGSRGWAGEAEGKDTPVLPGKAPLWSWGKEVSMGRPSPLSSAEPRGGSLGSDPDAQSLIQELSPPL